MNYRKWLVILLIIVLASVSLNFSQNVVAQEEASQVIDDFEVDELILAQDEFGNNIGYVPWGDSNNVELSLAEMDRDGATSNVMTIDYDITAYGGFTHVFTDGTAWTTQDWTSFGAIQFWLYGNNTGGTVQFEIFDNRNPDSNGDTAERWFYHVIDDYEGWQQFTVPFNDFQRRSDWQPDGAPSDEFDLNAVHGYAIGFPAGTGAQTTYLDHVEVIALAGQETGGEENPEWKLLADFEADELYTAQDEFGNNIGIVSWGDTEGNVELSLTDATREQTTNRALTIKYDITTFGGFSHVLTDDGETWTSQDWTAFNAITFWFLGSNTGAEVQFEIFDNRSPESDGDTAERWFYRFVDDSYGWKLIEIPFNEFQRRSDWQPDGAPNDGLNLDAVSGYAFTLPTGTGSQVAFIDDVGLFIMPGVAMPGEETAEVDGAVSSAGPRPEAIDNEVYVAPFSVAITLDGEFDDWDDVPGVYMGSGVGRPSVTFYAAADLENLYVYADVFDPNIVSGQHGSDYWNEDSIEFYFNGTEDLNATIYTDGIAQLTIPPLNIGAAPEDVILSGVRGNTLNANVIVVETEKGWAVEVAIPLQSDIWDITPETGKEMGFQVHLNAAAETNRDTKLIWSVFDTSDSSYQNPSVFGKLVFWDSAGTPIITGDYEFTSELGKTGEVDDFENGIWIGADDFDNWIGLVPQTADTSLAIRQILPETALALPGQEEATNVLAIETGGFRHVFTNNDDWISQDWSGYNAVGLWVYGTNQGDELTIEILNGLNAEDPTAQAIARYTLADDFTGWQYFTVPFALFEQDSDFNAAEVVGYGLSGTTSIVHVDDVRLFNVENTGQIITSDAPPEGSFILDDTISWDSREWELVWADEFDAESNTPIDEASWTCEVGGWGWGNNEHQFYTTSLDNVAHDGEGNLAIHAIQENYEDGECWYGACEYTSARCITLDKVEFTYGRVEARIRLPYGQGIWPAFWMLGANFPDVGWPASGEIDIMEFLGHELETVHGTIHGPGYSGASGIGNSYSIAENFSDDYHIFAIDWDPNVIRWYVDGELFGTVSVGNIGNSEWVYDHDFFLITNIAVGGNWPGYPDETTEFPQEMLIDYIRVYQLAE